MHHEASRTVEPERHPSEVILLRWKVLNETAPPERFVFVAPEARFPKKLNRLCCFLGLTVEEPITFVEGLYRSILSGLDPPYNVSFSVRSKWEEDGHTFVGISFDKVENGAQAELDNTGIACCCRGRHIGIAFATPGSDAKHQSAPWRSHRVVLGRTQRRKQACRRRKPPRLLLGSEGTHEIRSPGPNSLAGWNRLQAINCGFRVLKRANSLRTIISRLGSGCDDVTRRRSGARDVCRSRDRETCS